MGNDTRAQEIANIIKQQIRSAAMYVGAHNFLYGRTEEGHAFLSFKAKGGKIHRAFVQIALDEGSDDYIVSIYKMGRLIDGPALVVKQDGVYADGLGQMIERVIG